MTLLVKDANTTTQSIGTQPDAQANLAIEHVMCTMVAGVATPVTTLPVEIVGGAAQSGGGSFTITLGGTAQLLFGGITPPNGWWIQNLHATELLWVNDNGAAGANAGFQVPITGGIIQTPEGYKPMGPVSVEATTTGHPLTARYW